jgi:hypothetical protein
MEINNNSNQADAKFNQSNILSSFFSTRASNDYSLYQTLALDLYRSINFYRVYNDVSLFIEEHKEFTDYREDIEELWDEFSQMTDGELADVAIRILADL